MKAYSFTFSILTVLILNSLAFSAPFDVKGDKLAIVVNSHPQDKNLRSFQKCVLDKYGVVISDTCDQIGAKEYYSIKELKKIRTYEYIEAGGKTIADIGIVVALMYGGATIGAAATTAASSSLLAEAFFGTYAFAAGGLLGGATGFTITGYIDKLNPVHQFKQAAVLSNDLINDVEIRKSDEKVLKMVDLLNQILL